MSQHQERLAAEVEQHSKDTAGMLGHRFTVSFLDNPQAGLVGRLVDCNWTYYVFRLEYLVEGAERFESSCESYRVERANVLGMAEMGG